MRADIVRSEDGAAQSIKRYRLAFNIDDEGLVVFEIIDLRD